MLDNGHAEHLRSRSTVDISSVPESLKPPILARFPGQHPRFDGAEVRYDELTAGLRDQHGADQLGENVRGVAVDVFHHLELTHPDQFPRLVQCADVILREVLQLDAASGESSRAVGAVELEQSPRPAVLACVSLGGLVFLDAALGHLQSQLQHVQGFLVKTALVDLLDHGGHVLFAQGLDFDAPLLQPTLQLRHRVWVFKPGQFISSIGHSLGQHQVAGNCLVYQLGIDHHATVIDALIHVVVVPLAVRQRKAHELFSDGDLRPDILFAVFLEPVPVLRGVLRLDPFLEAVGLAGLLGHGEFLDQSIAGPVLLLFHSQHLRRQLQ